MRKVDVLALIHPEIEGTALLGKTHDSERWHILVLDFNGDFLALTREFHKLFELALRKQRLVADPLDVNRRHVQEPPSLCGLNREVALAQQTNMGR
jgi:hypothetical protein